MRTLLACSLVCLVACTRSAVSPPVTSPQDASVDGLGQDTADQAGLTDTSAATGPGCQAGTAATCTSNYTAVLTCNPATGQQVTTPCAPGYCANTPSGVQCIGAATTDAVPVGTDTVIDASVDVPDSLEDATGGGDAVVLAADVTFTVDELLKAAYLYSCFDTSQPGGLLLEAALRNEQIGYRLTLWIQSIPCLAKKTNACKAVEECMGLKLDTGGGPCTPGCLGNVATECNQGVKHAYDCSKVGAKCVTGEVSECQLEQSPACQQTVMDLHTHCVGDVLHLCVGGTDGAWGNCTSMGMDCGKPPGMSFNNDETCLGKGNSCDQATSPDACVSGKLQSCQGGKVALVDCDQQLKGSTCQTVQDHAFCGMGAECDNWIGQCDGDSALFCFYGQIKKVDCKALGFTHCDAGWCEPIPKLL